MIRFIVQSDDGRVLIGLGITAGNVRRMSQGEPILVKSESLNLNEVLKSGKGADICIFYGEDLESLEKEIKKYFKLTDETKIFVDPLLAAGVPEDARSTREGNRRKK